MKLDEKEGLKPSETELHAQKEIKKQQKLLGSLRLQPGHRIWKVNPKNLDVAEAEYEIPKNAVLDVNGNLRVANKKIIMEEGFTYVPALNQMNARKRFVKMVEEERKRIRLENLKNQKFTNSFDPKRDL